MTAIALVVAVLTGWESEELGHAHSWAFVLLVAASHLRHRWPQPVWWVCALVLLLRPGGGPQWVTAAVTTQIALVEIIVTCRPRPAAVAATLTLVLTISTFTSFQGLPDPLAVVSFLVWGVAGVATGLAVRSRRAYVAAIEERARRAEDTREIEAGRRVAEERLRIARELHDVVGHQMAVINVQMQLARRQLHRDPGRAAAALEHSQNAAGEVLGELGTLLRVLRSSDDGDETRPVAGLEQLPELLLSLRGAGLQVKVTTFGTRRPLPELIDVTAFRILQEGLTNAHRYGCGAARVDVAYEAGHLEIRIENEIGVPTARVMGAAGYGLIGMGERVDAVGGLLDVRQVGESFRVYAALPLEARS